MMKLYVTEGATMEESVCAWMKSSAGREVWEPWKSQISSPYLPPNEERCNLFDQGKIYILFVVYPFLVDFLVLLALSTYAMIAIFFE